MTGWDYVIRWLPFIQMFGLAIVPILHSMRWIDDATFSNIMLLLGGGTAGSIPASIKTMKK